MKFTDEQVQIMVKGSLLNRYTLARAGQSLETLVHDESWTVRLEVARQGYGLDALVNDPEWQVRIEVARQGYGLGILLRDSDWYVRLKVAEQGYRLDILAKDRNGKVRTLAEKLLGSERYLIDSNFGTYQGDLLLFVWKDRYRIISGCYETDSLAEWGAKCQERLTMVADSKGAASKYTKIMSDIIEEEVK